MGRREGGKIIGFIIFHSHDDIMLLASGFTGVPEKKAKRAPLSFTILINPLGNLYQYKPIGRITFVVDKIHKAIALL